MVFDEMIQIFTLPPRISAASAAILKKWRKKSVCLYFLRRVGFMAKQSITELHKTEYPTIFIIIIFSDT